MDFILFFVSIAYYVVFYKVRIMVNIIIRVFLACPLYWERVSLKAFLLEQA